MTWFSIGVAFVLIWWLVFFVTLPIGVKSQAEHAEDGGDVVPGTPESAPMQPKIWWKMLWTTVISAALVGVLYVALVNGWFDFLNVGFDQTS